MAPRRKKAGNQANEMERFRVGDLVLAKVKGFAAWPAKISRPEDWKRLPDPKKYFVRFFGTSEIGFVAPSNIKTFTIDLKSELISRPRIKHSKDFARAVDEICQAFEELQGSSSELPEKEIKLPEAPVENDGATGLLVQKEEVKDESVEASTDTKLKDEDTNCRSEAPVFSNDKSMKDPNDCPEVSRERESLTSPSLSTVSPIKEEPGDSLQEKIVHNRRRKKTLSTSESNEKSIKDPNNCPEVSSDRKIPTPPTPSTASPMKEGSGSSLPEEKVVQIRRRKKTVSASESNEKSIKDLNNFPEVSSERKSPTPPSPSTVSSIKEEHGNSLAEEQIVQIHRRKKAVPASESNEKCIKDPNNCPEISKERKSPTSPSPTTVSLIKEEPGDSLLEEKIVQTRRRKKTASASESNEKIIKDPNNCVEVSRERKSPTPSSPSRVSHIKEEPGDSLFEEEIGQTRRRKKTVSASESKVQVNKRQRQGDAGYKEVKTLDRRTSKVGGTLHVKEKDAVPIKSMENKKIHLSPSTDLPVSLSKKSPLRTRRRLLRIDDDEIDEEVNPTPVVNENLEDGVMTATSNAPLADSNSQVPAKSSSKSEDDSPNQNPCQAEERKPEKTPDKYERRRLSSSLDGSKSDKSAENKTRSMVKASTSGSSKTNDVVSKRPNAAVRQKPKLSLSISEKQKEKLQTKDLLSSKGFNLLQDHANVSVTFKSKFVDSSTSMKDLIAVAQAKRKETHSLGVYQENFIASSLSFHTNTILRERSRSPSLTVNDARSESKEAYGSMSSPDNNEPNNSLMNTLASEKNEQVNVSGGQKSSDDVEVSVARDAFEAMIETLSRTKESIGRATHQAIECAKLNMASEVVDLLIRKLETEISFRRRIDLFFLVDSITQCSHSRKGIAGASYVPSVQASLSRLLNAAAPPGAAACENRHQCLKVLKLWLERKIFPESVLRPIIDGLEVPGVDPSSGLYLRRQCRSERSIDDPIREMDGMLVDEYGSNVAFQLPGLLSIHDSEVEDDDLPNGLCDDVNVDLVNPLEEQNIQSETPIKRQQHVLEEVDGELEMEEFEERKKSRVENSSPPLPSNPPPSPPPLPPSSPPPLPPPPPPQQLSFALPPPTPPPVPYPALQHMPYPPSMHQDHFRTPNSHNPSFVMPGVNAGQLPQVNVRPSEYSHQEVHLPPHGYHSTVQYQPAAQTMVHMPYPPAPVGQTPQSQPPPHHPNLTPQPPPNNYQYPRHNPYFLPPPNPPLQHMSEGHWGPYPGWRPAPSSGAPLVHDGRFNPNLVAPVGSVPVPPAHVGPQVFPYRPDAPPLNCWRPS